MLFPAKEYGCGVLHDLSGSSCCKGCLKEAKNFGAAKLKLGREVKNRNGEGYKSKMQIILRFHFFFLIQAKCPLFIGLSHKCTKSKTLYNSKVS